METFKNILIAEIHLGFSLSQKIVKRQLRKSEIFLTDGISHVMDRI